MAIEIVFAVDPEFPVEEIHTRRGVSTTPDAGFHMSRQTAQSTSRNTSKREVRRWGLRWENADAVQAAAVETALDLTFGAAQMMRWKPPKFASTIYVRFPKDALPSIEQVSGTKFRMRVTFEEAI